MEKQHPSLQMSKSADVRVINKIYAFSMLLLNTKIKLYLSLLMPFHPCTAIITPWLKWNFSRIARGDVVPS